MEENIELRKVSNVLDNKDVRSRVLQKIEEIPTSIQVSNLTPDAMKFEPYRMCPSAFNTTFWQFFDVILQIPHNKTFKIRYIRCRYIVI